MIEIKNGKLLQDGVVIRPEFGNLDHIEAIKKAEERRDQLINGIPIDFDVDTKIIVDSSFKCACDRRVFIELEYDDDDWEDEVIGEKAVCHNCGQRWEIVENEDEDGFLVKMTT